MSHSRHRFTWPLRRPSWIVLLATALFVVLTVRLGYWQLGRGQHKAAQAAQLAERERLAVEDWRGELGEPYWQRRFRVQGVWQPQGQIYLDNRVHQRQAGFHVLTPLQLADGRWLLVNRGWLPKQPGQLPHAAPPTGPVQLLVRLQAPQQHYVELSRQADAGPVWQNLDWVRYQRQFPVVQVAALALQLDGQDALKRDWPAPDLGVEKHYSYAGQWFLFAALAVALLIILHWKRRPS